MKKLISSVIGCLLVLSPIKTLAAPKIVILEPEQSPPIPAVNHFVRAGVYGYPAMQVENGIRVLLELGRTREDTYLGNADGNNKGIFVEVNCGTGEGLVVGYAQNAMPIVTKPEPFNLFKILSDPYGIAISYACVAYSKH